MRTILLWLVRQVERCEQETSAVFQMGERWNTKLVLDMTTSLAEYLNPEWVKPETVAIGGDRLDV